MAVTSQRRTGSGRAAASIRAVVALAAVGLSLWLVARDLRVPKGTLAYGSSRSAADSTPDDGGGLLFAYSDAGAGPAEDAHTLVVSDLAFREPRADGGAGVTMLDGTPVPPLPLSVPRQAHFGVVLISYAGAQPNASGGRPSSRSRLEAKALALQLMETAGRDFRAAVQQGDAGSSDDLGSVKLGVLEPAPEYVLFTLPVGSVGGPVDTPRGYWILKRLE